MSSNLGKIPTGVRNILTESFDPLQKLTTVFWIVWSILLPQHPILHDLFTWKNSRGSNNCGTHCNSGELATTSLGAHQCARQCNWNTLSMCGSFKQYMSFKWKVSFFFFFLQSQREKDVSPLLLIGWLTSKYLLICQHNYRYTGCI